MVLSLSRCLPVQDTDKDGPSNIPYLENKLSEYFKGNKPVSEIEKWLEVSWVVLASGNVFED